MRTSLKAFLRRWLLVIAAGSMAAPAAAQSGLTYWPPQPGTSVSPLASPFFTGQWTVNGSLCAAQQLVQGGSPTTCTATPTVNKLTSNWPLRATLLQPVGAPVYSLNTWTATTELPGGSNTFRSVVWSAAQGKFVAVGGGAGVAANEVATSPDGVNWTLRSSSVTKLWFAVDYSPELDLFVATAATNSTSSAMSSPDGVTWTTRTTPSGVTQWTAVVWADSLGLFVAAGGGGTGSIMTSPDGITWTQRTTPTSTSLSSVGWSHELGVLVAGGVNYLVSSTDGITWTQRTSQSNSWNSGRIAWSPKLGLFLTTSSAGVIITSANGTTWSQAATGRGTIFGAVWVPELEMFVVTGSTTLLYTSTDGVTFTSRSGLPSAVITAPAWSPQLGRFVAAGNVTQLVWAQVPTAYAIGGVNPVFLTQTSKKMRWQDLSTSQSNYYFGTGGATSIYGQCASYSGSSSLGLDCLGLSMALGNPAISIDGISANGNATFPIVNSYTFKSQGSNSLIGGAGQLWGWQNFLDESKSVLWCLTDQTDCTTAGGGGTYKYIWDFSRATTGTFKTAIFSAVGGIQNNGVLAISPTAPTVASGGCTSPAVTHSNGTAAFLITIGTSCSGVKTVTLTMPAAAHLWACTGNNNTSDAAQQTNVIVPRATSATAVVLTSYDRVLAVQEDFTAGDSYLMHCTAE